MKRLLSSSLLSFLLLICPQIVLANTDNTSDSLEKLEQKQESISSEKLALIQELRSLINSEKLFQDIFDITLINIPKQTSQMIQKTMGKDLSESQKQQLDTMVERISKKMSTLIKEKIDLKSIQKVVAIHLYDKYYSKDELQDLVDFYKTPTGQKTIQVMPQLTQESMNLFNQLFVPPLVEIQEQIIEEELENLESWSS